MVLNKYVLKSEEFQSYAMVLLLAITAPNSAMLYSHFLLCRLCLSPGTAKTLLWSRPKNPSSGRKPLLFSLLFLPSSLIVMPRERWMKVDIFLHRSYFWGIGPSHYLVLLHSSGSIDSILGYICGFFSIPWVGNPLHMVGFSTAGLSLLDGMPSKGWKVSCFLSAASANRRHILPCPAKKGKGYCFTEVAPLSPAALLLFCVKHELQTPQMQWLSKLPLTPQFGERVGDSSSTL